MASIRLIALLGVLATAGVVYFRWSSELNSEQNPSAKRTKSPGFDYNAFYDKHRNRNDLAPIHKEKSTNRH